MSNFFGKAKKEKKEAKQQRETSAEDSPSPNIIPIEDRSQTGSVSRSQASIKTMGSGPFKRSKSSNTSDKTSDLAEQFFGIVRDISEATDILAPLKSASMLMMRIIQNYRITQNNATAWLDLYEDLVPHATELEAHRDILEGRSSITDQACLDALREYLRTASEIIEQASKPAPKGVLRHTIRHIAGQREKEAIDRHRQKLENHWQVYKAAMAVMLSLTLDNLNEQVRGLSGGRTVRIADDYGVLESKLWLAYGDNIAMCEPGTRTDVLDAIRKWVVDIETTEQIFWLNDAAGTGKSTIAATLAKEWQLNQILAGRFFFSPNADTTRTTSVFCLAIAKDMARLQRNIKDVVERALEKLSFDHPSYFNVQFQQLIVGPLQSLKISHPVCLVIDALDNCIAKEERKKLLEALLRRASSIKHLKILLTSRPLPDICDILQSSDIVCGKDIRLLDINAPAHKDVSIFVGNKLRNIAFVSEEHRQMIVSQANGLFLYASTVCSMLETSRRRAEILKILSASQAPQKMETRMDDLYLSVLRQALFDEKAGQILMEILCTIIVAFQPISINTISAFLPENHQVEDLVQDLGGVLKDGDPDRPIKVVHPTFREFVLSNRERANGFLVDSLTSHATVANACVNVLEQFLEYDILGVQAEDQLLPRNSDVPFLGQLIEKQTTPAVRYATAYWAHHATDADISLEMWTFIRHFLARQLLCWVELMSWRGNISLCVEGLARIHSKARKQHADNPSASSSLNLSVIRHAYQFVVHNQTTLAQAALQAYSISLVLTPQSSPIFDGYRERYRSRQPKVVTTQKIEWGSHSVLEGYTSSIEQLVFSPDSTRFIIISGDGVLRLFDAGTGAIVGVPFKDPDAEISVIGDCTFSSDGQQFAFLTGSNQVYMWDSQTGEEVLPRFLRGKKRVYRNYTRSAFSPTHPYLAAIDGPGIWMLHTKGGKDLMSFATYTDRHLPVDIAFSPDGKWFVCVGESKRDHTNGRAFVWDWESQKRINSYDTYKIKGWATPPMVAFSADSTRFATWGNEGAQIYLRESSTGDGVAILVGKGSDGCKSVVFSPQGSFLAAHGHDTSSITLWEQNEGKMVSVINEHSAKVLHISFSPDGQRLASVSDDQTVRIWSIPAGDPLESIFAGYTGDIRHPLLSPDWTKLVTISSENLNLYNLQERAMGSVSRGKPRKIMKYDHVAAPLTGSLIARGDHYSKDGGLQIWDTSTGEAVGPVIEGSRTGITYLVYSPDGQMIATTSSDLRIRIWDAHTQTMIGEPLHVPCLSANLRPDGFFFSPDSQLLGVCSSGSSYVWNVRTREEMWSHWGNSVYTYAFAFSPDSTHIAGMDANNVYITNVYTGSRILGPRKNSLYTFGAFSPTDPLLAVTYSRGLELWRIGEDLQLVAELSFEGGDHRGLTFSSDGRYLAHGPFCWDVSSVPPRTYDGSFPPTSFEGKGLCTHSFLTYQNGWIHSSYPAGAVLPVPSNLRLQWLDRHWYAYGTCVLLWNDYGEPIMVDCTPLLPKP